MSKVKTKRPNKIIGVLVRIDTDDSTIFDFQEGYRVDNLPEDEDMIRPYSVRYDDCEWNGDMKTAQGCGEMFDISDSDSLYYKWAWVSNKVNLTQKEYDLLNKCGVVG